MTDPAALRARLAGRIHGLVNRGAAICPKFTNPPEGDLSCLSCGYPADTHTLRDCLAFLDAAAEREQANVTLQRTVNDQARRLVEIHEEHEKLKAWRLDVTVAVQRPGGTFYEDVPKHIREMVKVLKMIEVADVNADPIDENKPGHPEPERNRWRGNNCPACGAAQDDPHTDDCAAMPAPPLPHPSPSSILDKIEAYASKYLAGIDYWRYKEVIDWTRADFKVTSPSPKADPVEGNPIIHLKSDHEKATAEIPYAEYLRLQGVEQQWKSWGIIEIAVRNPNVSSYMDHWEGRTLKAEAEVASLTARIGELTRDIESGFMAGAYARLKALQDAETELARLLRQ